MTTPILIHQVLTVLAAACGGGAWLALGDGALRVGLQLTVVVVVAFGAMLANAQHARSDSDASGGDLPEGAQPEPAHRR